MIRVTNYHVPHDRGEDLETKLFKELEDPERRKTLLVNLVVDLYRRGLVNDHVFDGVLPLGSVISKEYE